MSIITEKFKQVAADQNVQFKEQEMTKPIKDREGNEIEQKQIIFQSALQAEKGKPVPCAVIIHDAPSDRVNYQITYNKIGYVTDRNKLPDILTKFNELNSVRSGYYHFVVGQDGEVQLRHLGITGEDVRPLINTFIFGGRILRALLPELKQIEGLDLTVRRD
jgi:hypothetical protein